MYPYIFSFQAPPKAGRYFTENASKNDKLYNYRYGQYELFFYSEPEATQLLYNYDEMKSVAGKKGNWIFTDEVGYKQIKDLDLSPASVLQFEHFNLNRGAKFILPSKRKESLQLMYLIRF